MISERTKVALAAAKRRGKRLGNPNLPDAAKRGTAAVKANARRFAANVRPIIDEIIAAGATSHNAIAGKLNERNVRTARGGAWTHVQVGAILHPFAGASVVAWSSRCAKGLLNHGRSRAPPHSVKPWRVPKRR